MSEIILKYIVSRRIVLRLVLHLDLILLVPLTSITIGQHQKGISYILRKRIFCILLYFIFLGTFSFGFMLNVYAYVYMYVRTNVCSIYVFILSSTHLYHLTIFLIIFYGF